MAAVYYPKVLRKNYIDLSYSSPTITVTDSTATNDGSTFVDYLRNRDNESGWMTTGSNDAANTQLDIDMVDTKEVNTIILVKHNFKAFTIQYLDPVSSTYTDFSTPISETTNSDGTTEFYFDDVFFAKLRIIITGTQTADDDKTLSQLIITQRVGQFSGPPVFKNPRLDRSRKKLESLSGKAHVIERVGRYQTRLDFKVWPSDADMTLIETMFFYLPQGFLFWPGGGGGVAQYKYMRQGFKQEDIYLVKCTNEWEPEWYKGVFVNGISLFVDLVESI